MTILKCSAMTCVYNKEQLCSKGDIDVTGENATSANETSCGSFRERTGSSMKDSYTDDCGCDKIQIDCKAHNCTYNDNCKCTASSIQVDGSNAHASSGYIGLNPNFFGTYNFNLTGVFNLVIFFKELLLEVTAFLFSCYQFVFIFAKLAFNHFFYQIN